MKHVKDFDSEHIKEYTDEELKMFINQITMQRSVLQEKCAEEMAIFMRDERFDVYSNSGKRKMNKVSKKYATFFDGADYLEEIISEELKKREQYNEEQKYSGRSIAPKKMSKEEFLQKEEDKTWAYKSKIE